MREQVLERVLERYERTPHLVFWEVTKACALACRHCRASAQMKGLPGELTTEEGMRLLEQIAAMGTPAPIIVFTGGDCLARDDLIDLVDHARSLNLRMGIAPSVTERLTRSKLVRLLDRGVRSISISLDGAGPESHDVLRGVPGHFDQTLAALEMVSDMGFRLQVNTTVTAHNARELADVAALLRQGSVGIWEVFFLVNVGRGKDVEEVSAREAEDICHFLVDVSCYGFTVRTVEGPFYRRVQAVRSTYTGSDLERDFALGGLYRFLHRRLRTLLGDAHATSRHATLATGDGRGVIFVGHDGSILASGFLPVPLGNVRTDSLGTVYRENETLRSIRSGRLFGACGECDYRRLCGGSRARAYASSGEVLWEDPACLFAYEMKQDHQGP